LDGEVNLWGGAHGGPGEVGCQCGGEKDEDEPERAHVFQGNNKEAEFTVIGSQKERTKTEGNQIK